MLFKEIFVYGLVGVSSLTMLAYTVHMFIGGMVSERTEKIVMVSAVLVGAAVLALLAWDIIRRRRNARAYAPQSDQEDNS